jgi:hypothetical protein
MMPSIRNAQLSRWASASRVAAKDLEATMAEKRQLKLGHMIEGAGRTWTDWRHPDAEPGAVLKITGGIRVPENRHTRAKNERHVA